MSKHGFTLGGFLRRLGVASAAQSGAGNGSGARSGRVCRGGRSASVPIALIAALLALSLSAGSALAAGPPEAPTTSAPAKSITATTAILEGTLNPGASAKAGWYFAYSTEISCALGATTPLEAEVTSKAVKEHIEVTGLEPSRKYTFCMVATSEEDAAATPGNEVTFETKAAPPTIDSESVSNVKTSEATLEGVVNPNNQVTECHFQYGMTTVTENTVPCSPELLKGFGEQSVGPKNGEGAPQSIGGLTGGAEYKYRIVTKNGKGEEENGAENHFRTAEEPEKQATAVTATTATLNGVLNPHNTFEAGSYEFVYRQSAGECQRTNSKTGQLENEKATPATGSLGASPEPVSVPVSELAPGTPYTFCLLERNAAGEDAAISAPETFTTLATVPSITEQFVTELSATSATLHATVDPGGTVTTYMFEYARAGEEFKPVTEPKGSGSAGEGAVPVPVQVEVKLNGLTPASSYQFRVVASNSMQKEKTSEPVSFSTQNASTSLLLPDDRAYEMVSPPQKQGAKLDPIEGTGLIKAAASGDALTYVSQTPIEADPQGFGGEDVQNLATRGNQSDGWSSRDLTIPHEQETGVPVSVQQEYSFFSEDLSSAAVQPLGQFTPCIDTEGREQPCLSEEASEQTAFLQNLHTNRFTPLATGKEPYANVPSGTIFGILQEQIRDTGGSRECLPGLHCGPFFIAATPDLGHVVLDSETPLTAGSPGGLYEWSGGKLTFIGKGTLERGEEGQSGEGDGEGDYASHGAHGISADGSRVILRGASQGPQGEPLEGLLMRDTARGETVRLGEGNLQTASADDSRVFFDTGWKTGELDVFEETEASRDGGPLAGTVTELTEGKGFRGLVLGASDEACDVGASGECNVYFVSNGVLGDGVAHGATQGDCELEQSNQNESCNLYLAHRTPTGWETRFIAALSGADEHDWAGFSSIWSGALLSEQPVRVSPNGQWLTFMSQRSLTGYDNRDASNGKPDAEVYLYDAAAHEGAGSLICASCDPTGARPTGVEYEQLEPPHGLVGGPERTWNATELVAANLPGWNRVALGHYPEDYQPRYLSNGGRLFFDSGDALVPQDVDGSQDVYEYEPAGVGTCSESTSSGSAVFAPAADGCVALISSGDSSEESAFLDASEDGSDVFFLTNATLSLKDNDTDEDVYDAHECTPASPCATAAATPPPCDTEASCKAFPTPQPSIYGVPSSATFSGPGNLAPPPAPAAVKKVAKKTMKCKKGLVKGKKGRCVKKPKKKKTKAKKSNRRAQ
jgi:hypothetical protein